MSNEVLSCVSRKFYSPPNLKVCLRVSCVRLHVNIKSVEVITRDAFEEEVAVHAGTDSAAEQPGRRRPCFIGDDLRVAQLWLAVEPVVECDACLGWLLPTVFG